MAKASTKAQKRLAARIKDFEMMKIARGYRRPGSLKK